MYTDTGLKEEINITSILQSLFEAYEEVSVMQMKRIRDRVINARSFVDDVHEVYSQTKDIYSYRLIKKLTKNGQKVTKLSFSTIKKNGKRLKIFISPSERFSGDIGFEVFERFYEDLKARNFMDDVAIIGFLGKQMLSARNKDLKYKYLDIKTLKGDPFDNFIADVTEYETIDVYFGKFVNLLNQVPDTIDLMEGTQVDRTENVGKKVVKVPTVDYLFEPSIEGVMHFFEAQMIKAFFKQYLYESELARLGSRMSAMEIANQNAKDTLKKLVQRRIILDKAETNKRQLEQIAGLSLFNITQ